MATKAKGLTLDAGAESRTPAWMSAERAAGSSGVSVNSGTIRHAHALGLAVSEYMSFAGGFVFRTPIPA